MWMTDDTDSLATEGKLNQLCCIEHGIGWALGQYCYAYCSVGIFGKHKIWQNAFK